MINQVVICDCLDGLRALPDECVDCVVTSPPYFNMRDYAVEGQIGIEDTFEEYLTKLHVIFTEVKRVLKPTGTCFVNLGDSYSGSGNGAGDVDEKNPKARTGTLKSLQQTVRAKSLLMIPSRFAIMMCDNQWILRNDIIWHKSNAMPSSVTDRLTNKYEHVFFFTISERYYFNIDSIRIPYEGIEKRPPGVVRAREQGYNTKQGAKYREQEEFSRKAGIRRATSNSSGEYQNPLGKIPGDVWTLNLVPHKDSHIAMYPEKLIAPLILGGCPPAGIVLDPFMGAGTTARVAKDLGRRFIGFELNEKYCEIADKRLRQEVII